MHISIQIFMLSAINNDPNGDGIEFNTANKDFVLEFILLYNIKYEK